MKKLPEFIALGVGFGLLSLAGAIAWTTLEPQDVLEAQAIRQAPERTQQAGVLPSARR